MSSPSPLVEALAKLMREARQSSGPCTPLALLLPLAYLSPILCNVALEPKELLTALCAHSGLSPTSVGDAVEGLAHLLDALDTIFVKSASAFSFLISPCPIS